MTAALKDQLGRPLPLVDFSAIRADLAAFPLIRSFSTESHPPSTLVVRIVERVPVGVISRRHDVPAGRRREGDDQPSAARPAGFPVIRASGPAGSTDAQSGFDAAVAVLQALPANVLGPVDTVTAATRDDVTFTLRGSGAKVVWGSPDQSELKAADLAAIMKSAGATLRKRLRRVVAAQRRQEVIRRPVHTGLWRHAGRLPGRGRATPNVESGIAY